MIQNNVFVDLDYFWKDEPSSVLPENVLLQSLSLRMKYSKIISRCGVLQFRDGKSEDIEKAVFDSGKSYVAKTARRVASWLELNKDSSSVIEHKVVAH